MKHQCIKLNVQLKKKGPGKEGVPRPLGGIFQIYPLIIK
jgi:hypothetical protein